MAVPDASSASTTAQMTIGVLLASGAIIITVRLVGSLIARMGQPRVLGEITAGILLGPSVLGLVWPAAMNYLFPPGVIGALRVLAQFGLVIFMFLVGLELNQARLDGQGRRTVLISQASIVAPVLLGGGLGLLLYPRLGSGTSRFGFVLFLGAAMSVTAFPVLARILQETSLTDTRIGNVTMACAAVADVTAWCLLALIVVVIRASGPEHVLVTISLATAFSGAMLAVVKPLLARRQPPPLWGVLVIALVSAWITEQIGIQAIFGGFMAGVVMPRDHAWRHDIHRLIEPTVSNLLLPVFFVVVGLTTRIDLLDNGYLWSVTALVIVVAVLAKFGSATAAALASGESVPGAAVIGVLMNTRGLTEILILTVGLQLRAISPTVFTIMILMALVTTFMAMPALRMFSLLDKAREEDPGDELVPAAAESSR